MTIPPGTELLLAALVVAFTGAVLGSAGFAATVGRRQMRRITAVTEALANVVRHSGASQVDVHIEVGDELVLTVADDGKGFAADTGRRSGLGNLWERAEAMGGHLELGESELGGAQLRWSVPLAK